MSKSMSVIVGFIVGYVLVRLVYVILALVAAMPGLAVLLRGIKSAGLPAQIVYPLLTTYSPMVLTAFAVGCLAYLLLGGFSFRLFAALVVPWFFMGSLDCIAIAEESILDCWAYSDSLSFLLGVGSVPLGLLLAALAFRPPGFGLSVDTDKINPIQPSKGLP